MDGQVCATVIGEVAGKVASKVINTISRRQSVDEKLERLEMLVIKLRGTVEVSETLGAETVSLLQWRDKLKEAASKGNQVLLSFQRRAADGHAAAAEGSEEHQGGRRSVVLVRNILLALDRGVRKAATALLSYSECAASYTRNTLVGMARGVRSATTALLSCSEGVVKLNSTVDKLEKACEDIGEFISLHHAEASRAKVVCSPANRNRAGGDKISTRVQKSIECGVFNKENGKKDENNKKNQQHGEPVPAVMLKGSSEEPTVMSTALALVEISRAAAVADNQGLTDLEWLAELEGILQEDRPGGGKTLGIGREIMADKQEAVQVQQLRTSDAAVSQEEIEPDINEKLQRLEMLVVNLRSTVEVSLRLGAKATSLLQWQDKLSEAASKGHLVLLNFKRRVLRVCAAATDATDEHKGRGKSGSTMFFIKKALLSMTRGVQKSSSATATKTLLLAGEGGIELNSMVGRLEKVCAEDVEDFIRLLQVETSQVEVMHMPTKRKKLELKTKLDRAENMNIVENVILQDTSVSREDGTRGRRRFVLSSSSGEDDDDDDFSKNKRTRRRLTGSYSSSSSSTKEGEARVGDEDGFRNRRSTGLLSSSLSSSKGGEGEDFQSRRRRIRLTGLFSSPSSSFSLSPSSSSSLSSPFSLRLSSLQTSASLASEEGYFRMRGTSYISSSPNDWIRRRSFLVGEEELEEEEKEQAMLMAMARFQDVLAKITKAVEMAKSRDLTGLEWLEEWAYILRDARQRGYAINLNGGEQEVEGICNAANILETLALDVECFISLVLLCPSIPTTKKIS